MVVALPGAAASPIEEQRALVARARALESTGDPAGAVILWQEALRLDPAGPHGPQAAGRVAWLLARQDADGTFATLHALEAARRGDSDQAVAVLGLAARPGVSLTMRADVAVWRAVGLLAGGDAAGALAATDAVWHERAGLATETRALLVRHRAMALARLGRLEEATAVEAEILTVTDRARPGEAAKELVERRRARLGVVAWAVLGAWGTAACLGAWWNRKHLRHLRPWGLVPLVLLLAGTGVLLEAWSEGLGRPAGALVAGCAAVHALTAGAQAGAGRWVRLLLGLAAFAATLGTGYLVLWHYDLLDTVWL